MEWILVLMWMNLFTVTTIVPEEEIMCLVEMKAMNILFFRDIKFSFRTSWFPAYLLRWTSWNFRKISVLQKHFPTCRQTWKFPPPPSEQTDTTENTTFMQLRWRRHLTLFSPTDTQSLYGFGVRRKWNALNSAHEFLMAFLRSIHRSSKRERESTMASEIYE